MNAIVVTLLCAAPLPRLVNRLIPFQHLDKFPNLPHSCLRLLHRLNAKQYRIPIRTVETLKESAGPWTLSQRCPKILGNSCAARRVIGRFPSAVGFGVLNRFQARRLHTSTGDQGAHFSPVDFRPDTFCSARKKTLQPRLLTLTALLPVDP